MSTDIDEIAASFDARAPNYSGNEWHRYCAERLVSLCSLKPGQAVLDAGTGTGFAALAAARSVGASGRVLGVDVSAGMLNVARAEKLQTDAAVIEWRQGDATQLPAHNSGSLDVVVCAAALLYMPVGAALREWHRILKPGGTLAFSTMRAGSPVQGAIFRECAATLGLSLRDPSEELGSEVACGVALERAGFTASRVIGETIEFSTQDLSLAWESNLRSAVHADALRLSVADRSELRLRFEAALADMERQYPGALKRAEVLYVVGAA